MGKGITKDKWRYGWIQSPWAQVKCYVNHPVINIVLKLHYLKLRLCSVGLSCDGNSLFCFRTVRSESKRDSGTFKFHEFLLGNSTFQSVIKKCPFCRSIKYWFRKPGGNGDGVCINLLFSDFFRGISIPSCNRVLMKTCFRDHNLRRNSICSIYYGDKWYIFSVVVLSCLRGAYARCVTVTPDMLW